jgi:hypothetical protein
VTTVLWPWPLASGEEASAVVEPLTPLGRDRRVFTRAGAPWTWKGLSAFPWCDRFARGDDLGPLLDPFQALGYNLLRVWDYVTWEGTGWESQPPEVWLAFLQAMEGRGFYVELTLMTDDLPHRYAVAEQLVEALAAAQPANLVVEIGNEPNIHKHIEVERLRAVCEASGFLFASGLNDVPAEEWFGLYLTAHTPRDYEWPRKCHDLLEYYNGGGPGAPTDPPHHVPCASDEGLQPQRPPPYDSGLAYQDGDLTKTGHDYRAYSAGCIVMGPGATLHWEGGKFGLPPTPEELHCAKETALGLSAFPAGSSNLGYRRIDEQGKTSRTYCAGPSMVRIRPETTTAPEPGWTCIDPDGAGILWTRTGTQSTPMHTRTVRLEGRPLSDAEENRYIDWLRARGVQGNISLGNDGQGQLFVEWLDGPTEDELRQVFRSEDQ